MDELWQFVNNIFYNNTFCYAYVWSMFALTMSLHGTEKKNIKSIKKEIVSRTVWAIITSFVILYYLSISISRILMVDDQL